MTPRLVVKDIHAKSSASKLIALQNDIRQLKEDLTRTRSLVGDLKDEIGEKDRQLNLVSALSGNINPMAVKPLAKNAVGEAVACGIFSDFHAFERVFPEQTAGRNIYNRSIARADGEEFFRACLKWTVIHRAGTAIPQFMLVLAGDLITNMLHLDQIETNEGTPQEEILFVLSVLSGGINFLLDNGGFEKLHVVCCDGNHGRDTEKMRIKNRAIHSHEWLVYQLLARMFSDDERISFSIAQGPQIFVPVFDKTIRVHHGDLFKFEGGVGGITIPIRKQINEWNKARWADLDIFGHWHTTIFDNQFVSNGSVMGYSEFSVFKKLSYEPPQQSFVLFDKKRWITSFNRILFAPRCQ